MNRILNALVILCILAVNVFCKDETKPETEEAPRTFRRLIPADVLRGKYWSISKEVLQKLIAPVLKPAEYWKNNKITLL